MQNEFRKAIFQCLYYRQTNFFKSCKVLKTVNVFNLTGFYFLASFGSFALINKKERRRQNTKDAKTTKMKRGTIEGSLSLRKGTVISSDTWQCGDCRCLFKNVEYIPGCLFSSLGKERRFCHRIGRFVE